MKKLFLILIAAFLLIANACSGGFIDPGMLDQPGGGFGGGGGGLGGGGNSGGSGGGLSSIPLTANKWTDGTITASQQIRYSFNVTKGSTYYVWWNTGIELFGTIDTTYGDGTKTGRIFVMAVYLSIDGSTAFLPTSSSAWVTPQSFIATSSSTVYITVTNVLPGTFAITYNTTGSRPNTASGGGGNPAWPTEFGGATSSGTDWGDYSSDDPYISFYTSTGGGSGIFAFMSFSGSSAGFRLVSINGTTLKVKSNEPSEPEYILCTSWSITDNKLTLSGGDEIFSDIMDTPLAKN